MIVLSQTTDNLLIVLKGAITTSQLSVLTSWRDITTTGYTPGRTTSSTNNTTDVAIVAGPAASTERVVDSVWVYNADTTESQVTIKFDAGAGPDFTIGVWVLRSGERLEYSNDGQWRVYTSSGALKTSQASGAPVGDLNMVVLPADVVNDDAVANTIADVTDLEFPVVAGETYWFRFSIAYDSASTGTGSRWSINGPAAPTRLHYHNNWPASATATATRTSGNYSDYDQPTGSNAGSLLTGNLALIEGVITPSSDGVVVARFASEVLSSAITAKAGSVLLWARTL